MFLKGVNMSNILGGDNVCKISACEIVFYSIKSRKMLDVYMKSMVILTRVLRFTFILVMFA